MPRDPMPPPAEAFGDYRLVRVLGEGASATVHLAQDLRNGGWVALKILQPGGSLARRLDARQRFEREAELVKRLQHPHIVTLHAVGESEGRLWLAMEVVPGCSLERFSQGQRLLAPTVVARVGEHMAQALGYAHGQGVVHRDIKPSNAILDLASGHLKLTDFGTARLLDQGDTGTGLLLGSPAYMAPELLAGKPADAASDLYALGVLLFELLAGRRPHESASMGELLRQVAAEPAPDVRSLRPDVPVALAAAVSQLLDKRPAARPSSGAAAAAELARARAATAGQPDTAAGGALSH